MGVQFDVSGLCLGSEAFTVEKLCQRLIMDGKLANSFFVGTLLVLVGV